MNNSILYKILVESEKDILCRYIRSIQRYLHGVYGDQLQSLYTLLDTAVGEGAKLVYLMTLNREAELKRHLCDSEPEFRVKHEAFFSTLHATTEAFLDHELSISVYIRKCTQAWVLA